jgi:microcystin degradation protein MlrC
MQAENENDPEGLLLEQARLILGEDIPIVISMDLHGIMTDRMLRHTDAIVVYHTYPHVDFKETGERAARLLLKILDGQANPVTAVVPVPALVRGDELITDTGSIRHVIRAAEALEDVKALSAGMFWGNPFTDVPELRSNSIVVVNGDEELARNEALSLADLFWEHHEKMQVPLTSIEDALKLATKTKGTTVLMDAADATSSGASGDSNAIIRGVVDYGYRGRVLAPVVDPGAVRAAFAAGVGETIRTTVGGALDTRRFTPLPVVAKVRLLSDGQFRSESFGWNWDAGDTAVLEADNLTLVVTTKPVSLFDRSLFWSVGQEPKRFDLVVVKSPHCEPQMFRDWCGRLINVDAPGSTSAKLKRLGHKVCARPVFPLDPEVRFDREVRIYRRR